jgi:hypothetical protein
MTEENKAPERIFVPQESDGKMHYQWSTERADFVAWEHGIKELDEAPRGPVVEYVRADLFEAQRAKLADAIAALKVFLARVDP